MFDQAENFRSAIRKKKALIESLAGSKNRRTIERRLKAEYGLADLERVLLLEERNRSTDANSRAFFERQLNDRGTFFKEQIATSRKTIWHGTARELGAKILAETSLNFTSKTKALTIGLTNYVHKDGSAFDPRSVLQNLSNKDAEQRPDPRIRKPLSGTRPPRT